MSYGSLWQRWFRGVSWSWIDDRYRARVPDDLGTNVMSLESGDRFHAKQGRSTARVVFVRADRPLAVYLKRHFRLPWPSGLAALIDPAGKHSPAAAEWSRLERARALGIDVPEVVAAGEQIGPRGQLRSFLMIAELSGCEALNEFLPGLSERLDAPTFAVLKRRIISEMARITATLHSARAFHKDLYLCHFFLDDENLTKPGQLGNGESGVRPAHAKDRPQRSAVNDPGREGRAIRLSLIDLHRLKEHKLWPDWWRWKDLGQLLFSTYDVAGITDGDRLRFWTIYRRTVGIRQGRWHARMIRIRAARYRAHNRTPR